MPTTPPRRTTSGRARSRARYNSGPRKGNSSKCLSESIKANEETMESDKGKVSFLNVISWF